MKALHFLRLCAVSAAAVSFTLSHQAAAADLGMQVFQNNCAVCHQAEAQGMVGLAPPLKGTQWAKLNAVRQYVPGVLLVGMHGVLNLDDGTFNGVMPPKNALSDEEIAAVSNYLFSAVNAQENWQPIPATDITALRLNPPSVANLRVLRKQVIAK